MRLRPLFFLCTPQLVWSFKISSVRVSLKPIASAPQMISGFSNQSRFPSALLTWLTFVFNETRSGQTNSKKPLRGVNTQELRKNQSQPRDVIYVCMFMPDDVCNFTFRIFSRAPYFIY